MTRRELLDWVRSTTGSAVQSATPLGGGCINDVQRMALVDGRSVVLKTRADAPGDFFSAEAGGLLALAKAGAHSPAVIAVGKHVLLLQDLGEAAPRRDYWESLAQQLARVHAVTGPRFGWDANGYIGLTPQPNRHDADGYRFFAEQRLRFQARLAGSHGLLEARDEEAVDRLCARLGELVPVQAAVLVHGDLWSGNIHCAGDGSAALLDPACHYGWAETDLAMSLLFGELPAAFYAAYESLTGIDSSWRARAPLYNLYHLLNHLNLFGRGYLASVRGILERFA